MTEEQRQQQGKHLQNKTDITDELTPFELNELLTLANESDDKNIIFLDEYRTATERWRTKL